MAKKKAAPKPMSVATHPIKTIKHARIELPDDDYERLKSAADRGVQVAFTTHSPWLLDHVQVDDIILVRRVEGETVYSRFADQDEVKIYRSTVPPGAIYAAEG